MMAIRPALCVTLSLITPISRKECRLWVYLEEKLYINLEILLQFIRIGAMVTISCILAIARKHFFPKKYN